MNLPMSPIRRWSLPLACVLLLATVPLGCSDDDSSTGPEPSSGSWADLGLVADFVSVRTLTSWNDLLVVGGHFNQFEGHLDSDLLTWDGSTWTRLERPFVVAVNALSVYEGHLIVGGFHQDQTDTFPTIAAFDGVQWSSLGTGLDPGFVTALTNFEGDLIAAVLLESTFEPVVSHVARWNGTSWQMMGGTLDGYVHCFTEFQGSLVVGGSFDTADGVVVDGIAAWSGTAWAPVGGGVGGGVNSLGQVLAMTADGTTLFAGGDFVTAGGIPANNVARWNGSAWDSMGAGLRDPRLYFPGVRDLTMLEGALVAGVEFADALPVKRWDGGTWVPMSTLSGSVIVFTMHNGSLIAGGVFPPTGTQTANGVARWSP
jgi:trimeric autotransporter adhesin